MSTSEEKEPPASAVAVADTGSDTDAETGPEVASPEVASPEVASPEVASPEVASPEVASSARERRSRWWVSWLVRLAWLAWPGGLVAAGIGLYLCYLHLSRTQAVSSDGASNALQAWDMLHGNPLLRGWTVTDVSFYTTELPEYMLVEAIRGLRPDVLHISAAISYTLAVLTGGMLARGRATGREGIVRMLIAAGIMVAPQLGPGIFILVFQPDHIGTQAPLLLTWLVLDRSPQYLPGGTTRLARAWWVPVAVGAMLTWVEVADRLAVLIGAARASSSWSS